MVTVSQSEQNEITETHPAGSVDAFPVDAVACRSWVFKPNCSLTPRQLIGLYLSLVVVTLSIAGAFCLFGLWMVLPFAGIELFVVGVAFLIYARHAGDFEQITIRGREINIQVMHRSQLVTFTLNPAWTRVVRNGAQRLLTLESGSTRVAIGRYVTEPVRDRLVYELRRAFALAAA